MDMRKYALKTFGIELQKQKVGLTYEERVLLMKIHESQRQATLINEVKSTVVSQYGSSAGIHIEVDNFDVDIEFSKLCSEILV